MFLVGQQIVSPQTVVFSLQRVPVLPFFPGNKWRENSGQNDLDKVEVFQNLLLFSLDEKGLESCARRRMPGHGYTGGHSATHRAPRTRQMDSATLKLSTDYTKC